MSKKKQLPKPRVRIDVPWHHTAEGTIQRALELHREYQYTELVIVALRPGEPGKPPEIDTLMFARDKLRLIGMLRWALDRISLR